MIVHQAPPSSFQSPLLVDKSSRRAIERQKIKDCLNNNSSMATAGKCSCVNERETKNKVPCGSNIPSL